MLVLAEQQQPELAADPLRRAFLGGMTLRLALNLAAHAVVTAWSVTEPRETWLFVSGPLQYVMLGGQFVFEIAWGRHTLPPEPEESPGDPPASP